MFEPVLDKTGAILNVGDVVEFMESVYRIKELGPGTLVTFSIGRGLLVTIGLFVRRRPPRIEWED